METNATALDRRESISRMEPLRFAEDSRHREALADLAFDLAQRSASFRSSLPSSLIDSIATLVRSMNCYYSNLIEGHNTHPIEIENALRNEYSGDRGKRNLQLEATAHIRVQKWIDEGGLKRGEAVSTAGICEIHRRFCESLPEDLLWVENPATGDRARAVPGTIRERDVEVGTHKAVSPGAVPRFLLRFEQVYRGLGKSEAALAMAAAHHRLLWIHPFLDGNGRVARLMSHAMMLETLETGAVWSVARGLARNVDRYKQLLGNCDRTRRNDLDGRGNLSEEALAEFTRFFLTACLDQVAFMEGLMEPHGLRSRILLWVEEEVRMGRLPARSGDILEAILYRGELRRGEAESILGTKERQSRRIVGALVGRGLLESESSRAPLRLVFPAALAHRWMPGLFPARPE